MNFEEIQDYWQRAEQYRINGEFLAAYTLYIKILEGIISEPEFLNSNQLNISIIILATADLNLLVGNLSGADNLFKLVVDLCQSSDYQNLPVVYFTILKRISLALERGLFFHVKNLLDTLSPQIGNITNIDISPLGLTQWESRCEWNDSSQEDQRVLFVYLYLIMGKFLSSLGQYHQSLVMLDRGFFHAQSETPYLASIAILPIKFAIALAYLEKGELTTAKTHLTDLKQQFNIEQQQHLYIHWLELSGKINLLQGNLGEALTEFEQIKKICIDLSLRRANVQATLNLAHILILTNQTSLAKDYLQDIVRDAEEIRDEELIQRINNLLNLADERGQSFGNEPFGFSVTQMRKRNSRSVSNQKINNNEIEMNCSYKSPYGNYLAQFNDRVLEIYHFLNYFQFDNAYQRFNDLNLAFQLSDSRLIQVRIQILSGILAYYYGVENKDNDRIRWAVLVLEECCPLLQELSLKHDLWQVKRFLIWSFTRLNNDIQEKLIEETNQILTELTNSLPPEKQIIFLLNKWTADEEYIASQINQLQRLSILTKDTFYSSPWQKWKLKQNLHHLLEHIDRYKDTLARRNLQNQVDFPLTYLTSKSFLSRVLTHPIDRVTIVFLVLPDRVLIVCIGWLIFNFKLIFCTRLEIRNLVQYFHKKLDNFNNAKRDLSGSTENKSNINQVSDMFRTTSSQLSELLQIDEILEKLPKRIKSITFIPDDILHGFPFGVLIYRGDYIIKKYALSVSYESKPKAKIQKDTLKEKSAILVGISQSIKTMPSLPGVEQELRQINLWFQKHLTKVFTYKNNEAQKEIILEKLKTANLLHIACHGTFEHNKPDQSGLVLTEEILSLRELSYLDLTQLDHATLSSCFSADHFISPGRWVISLPETLWRSGTQSILGCLWEVDDQIAIEFITRFYLHLDKLSRDKALHQTQLECLQGKLNYSEKSSISNPIFWSGFTLYGNFKKLEF
jgi:CHAT domain-containing protein